MNPRPDASLPLPRIPAPDGPPGPFSPRAVPPAVVQALVAAARVAPSTDNLQPWRFVVVRSAATRGVLAAAVPGPLADGVAGAPVVLAACGVGPAVPGIRIEQPSVLLDVSIAVTHVLLLAAELGLATAWTLRPDEAAVRKALAIPDAVRVVAVIGLGWPAY